MSGPDFKWWQPSGFYHLKSGQKIGIRTIFVRISNGRNKMAAEFRIFSKLDRFIIKRVIKNILFMLKRPRLMLLLLPFENRTNKSGFQMVETKWPPNFEFLVSWTVL